MYEQLMGFKYELSLNGETIAKDDKRRNSILSLQTVLRRKESSSLTIKFADPNLYWTNYFATKNAISVKFKGYNLDGSAPEEFEGYAVSVSPDTDLKQHNLEVMFLDVPPAMTRAQTKSRVFGNVSRKSVVQKLATEMGARVTIEDSVYINQVDGDLTLNINDSIIQFLSQILEDIGYCIVVTKLNQWTVAPLIPLRSAKNVHSNIKGDGSLLRFEPNFNPYTYTEDTKGVNGEAVDPDTKQTASQGDKPQPTNTPTNSKSNKIEEVYYDSKTRLWMGN